MQIRRIGDFVVLVLSMVLLCPTILLGQGFQPRFSTTEGMLLPAPREVDSLLSDAREAVASQQWSEATLALGTLLGIEDIGRGFDGGEDYFVFEEINGEITVQGTIIQSAHQMLSEMPEEGQTVIELRYGVNARKVLDEAVSRWDWDLIQFVASRFSFTVAGQEAMLMAAERSLGEGNPREAARTLDRLLKMESARKRLGAPLGLMTVAAHQATGSGNAARESLALTRRSFPSWSTEWNGVKLGWNEKTTDESILQSLANEPAVPFTRAIARPAFPGGNSQRNGDSKGGLPLPILRWHVELHESFQHKDNLDRALKKQLADRGKSVLLPTRYPIAVDSWILAPTYDQRVLAIDAKTGLIGWPCVFSGMPLGFSLDRFSGRDGFSLGMPAPDYLVRRVWGDTAVGQIASDGERLFTLSELPAVDVAESFAQGPNARLVRNLGIRTFNVLQAWSIRDQGKLLWECGGPAGGSSPDLAGALFLGAPLPHRGNLLCLVELNGEIFLVSFSPRDGKPLWRQPIAANQGTTISIDAQRRSYGASPSADGSIILCPTLSGFLVAYDMSSRELLWQYRYALNPNLNPGASFNFIGGMDARESNPTVPRTVETSPLIHDGVVVFAPPNGNSVAGVSLADGTELWQMGFDEPTPLRYVAGAYRDTVVLVQNASIVGLNIKTGQPKWKPIAVPNEAQVVGRSVRNGNKLLVPLSNQEILSVNLEQGTIEGTVRVVKPLGNLIVVEDRLISASPFQLDCYSIRDVFESRLLEELQRDGETVRSLVKQGELHIASGEIDEALEVLERARKLAPNDPEVRLRIVEVGTQALRKDFDKYVDRVQQYQELTLDLDLPSYLRILIHGLEKQNRWEEALAKLLDLSDARVNRRLDQMSDGQDIDLNPQWTVQEDRWISSRIARCVEKISSDSLEKLKPMILKRTDPAANRDRGILRLRLEHLQALPESESLRLAAANAMIKSSPIEAERLLRQEGGWNEQPIELSPERKALLAEIYLRSNRPYLAFRYTDGQVALLQQLLEKVASDIQPYAMRGEVDPRQVAQFAAMAKSLEAKHVWPEGEVDVIADFLDSGTPRQFDSMSEATSLCPVGDVVGDAWNHWQAFYSPSGFQFLNSVTNEQFQQIIDSGSLDRSTTPKIYAVDSLVLIELRSQLIALDTLQAFNSQQDGQLWRSSFGDDSQEVERGRGRTNVVDRNAWGLPIQRRTFRIAAVSRYGVVVLNNDELSCLDLFTGTKLWNLSGFKNASFTRDDNLLVAFQPSTGQVVQMDVRDGMIVKTVDVDQKGWQPMATIGKRWLFTPERSPNGDRNSEMKLRLVDPITGGTLLEREHTLDTRLAIVDETGIAALRTDGQLFYWNAAEGTEATYRVDVEGKFGYLSAQVFGDTALILPYAGSMELDKFAVYPSPRNDPSVAACAGRLFAISVTDGKPIWERTQRVKQFLFPLSQSRESPAAVFVRRLSLTKVRGQNLDFTSIALVDVKTGRLLFQKHDMPAVRGEAFRQRLIPSENAMVIKYLGNTLTARWSDVTIDLPPADQMDEIGELDYDQFRSEIEKQLDESEAKSDVK